MMPPRIRGRLAQIEDPPELKGKWAYEISMWDLIGETMIGGEPIKMLGPFDTEEEACRIGKEACRVCCDTVEEKTTGQKSGKYLDLKNGGVLHPWDEHS